MYDDFIERRPEAAKNLKILLNEFTRRHLVQDHIHEAAGPPRNTLFPGMGSSIHQQVVGSRLYLQSPPEAYDLLSHYRRLGTTVLGLSPGIRWLLLCAKAVKSPIGLAHLNVCNTSLEKELLEKIKRTYLRLHGRWKHWLPLKRTQEIRFVQIKSQSVKVETTEDSKQLS